MSEARLGARERMGRLLTFAAQIYAGGIEYAIRPSRAFHRSPTTEPIQTFLTSKT